jgi:thiol-disulfide isomerase/thioredoxin
MGKASRTKQEPDRRARIAAQREAERRAEQRRRIYLAGGSILVVVIVVIAFVLIKLNSGGGTAAASSNGPTGTALASVTKQVTDVPTSVTDKVGAGGVPSAFFVDAKSSSAVSSVSSSMGSYFATVDGKALTENGKPEVLFIGSEYCPYCAAQRWAMVNAFSRFGTFTGLTTTHSSSSDVDANTPTFTFYGSKYTSNYISFTSVELNKNYRQGNSTSSSAPYVTLQTPTAAEQATQSAYDPQGYIPFIDFGNKYVQVGNISPLTPTMLDGKTWAQVAAAMNEPSSSIAQAVDANANYETAAICQLTNNQPATACTAAIQKLETTLAK